MQRTILLSAYACEPGKGSEPGIGWNWAKQLSREGHEVWLLTQPHFVPAIEKACKDDACGLHAVAVPIPFLDRFKAPLSRMGTPYWYVHAYAWQVMAFLVARKLMAQRTYDWVHHVTFGSARLPSFMGLLGLPFLFGPVAGGEVAPWRLRKSFPIKGRAHALLRDLSNAWLRLDPLVRLTFRRASWIIATSPETQQLIPRPYRGKSHVQLAIGIDSPSLLPRPRNRGPFRLLFVGRLLYWKGLHLALEALNGLRLEVPEARMTIIGSGPEQHWFKAHAERLGLMAALDWFDWMPREAVEKAYGEHDVFLFPSLHDSGGMVVLEALSHGVPVVCLDLGGPGMIVDATCGRVICTAERQEGEVVRELSLALRQLAQDPGALAELRQGAIAKAQAYAWSKVVAEAYRLSSLPVAARPGGRMESSI